MAKMRGTRAYYDVAEYGSAFYDVVSFAPYRRGIWRIDLIHPPYAPIVRRWRLRTRPPGSEA